MGRGARSGSPGVLRLCQRHRYPRRGSGAVDRVRDLWCAFGDIHPCLPGAPRHRKRCRRRHAGYPGGDAGDDLRQAAGRVPSAGVAYPGGTARLALVRPARHCPHPAGRHHLEQAGAPATRSLMTTFLAIDAGGSKTTVLLAQDDRVIARATGAPGAVRPGRALQAAGKIAAAARRALTEARLLQVDVLVVGAAGVGRDPERSELREGLRSERLANHTVVTGDLDIALEAAFGDKPGIVLVSGTRSVSVAR